MLQQIIFICCNRWFMCRIHSSHKLLPSMKLCPLLMHLCLRPTTSRYPPMPLSSRPCHPFHLHVCYRRLVLLSPFLWWVCLSLHILVLPLSFSVSLCFVTKFGEGVIVHSYELKLLSVCKFLEIFQFHQRTKKLGRRRDVSAIESNLNLESM
jgi:hypothetical protein